MIIDPQGGLRAVDVQARDAGGQRRPLFAPAKRAVPLIKDGVAGSACPHAAHPPPRTKANAQPLMPCAGGPLEVWRTRGTCRVQAARRYEVGFGSKQKNRRVAA